MKLVGLAVVALATTGCLTEGGDPKLTIVGGSSTVWKGDVATVEFDQLDAASEDNDFDPCALAAELPADNVCSLVCAPEEFATRLVSNGSNPGACYQLYCELPGDHGVSIGVCIP